MEVLQFNRCVAWSLLEDESKSMKEEGQSEVENATAKVQVCGKFVGIKSRFSTTFYVRNLAKASRSRLTFSAGWKWGFQAFAYLYKETFH